jgi:hypothetical protein
LKETSKSEWNILKDSGASVVADAQAHSSIKK